MDAQTILIHFQLRWASVHIRCIACCTAIVVTVRSTRNVRSNDTLDFDTNTVSVDIGHNNHVDRYLLEM